MQRQTTTNEVQTSLIKEKDTGFKVGYGFKKVHCGVEEALIGQVRVVSTNL